MGQLEGLLADLPAGEREEALQYYNDYFEDAGPENEEQVITSLGSPRQIAENIKSELSGEKISGTVKASDHALIRADQLTEESAESSLGRAQEAYVRETEKIAEEAWRGESRPEQSIGTTENRSFFSGIPAWGWVLIVLGALVVLPGLFGILAGVAGTLVGLVAAWFGILIAFAAAAFGLFVSALAVAATGVLCAAVSPIACVTLLGLAMLLGGFAILLLMLVIFLAGKVTPAIFRGIWRLVKWVVSLFTGKRKNC